MDFIRAQSGALVAASVITVLDVSIRGSGRVLPYALTAEIVGREGALLLGSYDSRLEAEDAREKVRRELGGRVIGAPTAIAELRRMGRGIDALIPRGGEPEPPQAA